MENQSIGFIGGGRIVRIILAALQRKYRFPETVVVGDPNADVLKALQKSFSGVNISFVQNNPQAAKQEIVFLAVHPPAMSNVLQEIAPHLRNDAIVISLAPKFRIAAISELLSGHRKIVRMIPNAASLINKGFNPVSFAPELSGSEKQNLLEWFSFLGTSPEVDEGQLEAYALITAMGPTYFWFQMNELENLSRSFGLSPAEAKIGIREMIYGTAELLDNSGLNYQEVIDLIPVKPIGEHEMQIRGIYRDKLTALYEKLK